MKLHPALQAYVRAWLIEVESTLETATSFLAFGRQGDRPVVLKVLRAQGDEWPAGLVLEAFGGRNTVQVYQRSDEAVLLERLIPGNALVELVLAGRDQEATDILANLIAGMSPDAPPPGTPTASTWAAGFDRYLASGDQRIPRDLVRLAQAMYLELCASQGPVRLLHGDLQHYNVLFDRARGWLAIDPKGVTAELEYELGALFRNPIGRPDLYPRAEVIQARLDRLVRPLSLDPQRVRRWALSQAVLSVIWSWEDGESVSPSHPVLGLARTLVGYSQPKNV